ncbi:hypothetical protein IEO21_09684 [Rhodonia placenta]|uniref:Uncharacterized protein n=1 Tax=Rhodonia placenta TaxID=104341 RepID=A0A8H7TXH7_9APHY|nr:hypothetical protein IEO21_09684 [Postia placenta]
MLDSSDWHVAPFFGSDGSRSAIRARLSITDEEWSFRSVALWVVAGDVDLLLGVKCMLKSRAVKEFVSHGDGGKEGSMQQEPKPRVREFRPNVTTWGEATRANKRERLGAFDWVSPKRWAGCARWSVHSWSVRSMLTWPRGPVSQSGCVSGARAVPCTAAYLI